MTQLQLIDFASRIRAAVLLFKVQRRDLIVARARARGAVN
jgi:hypothetical protein